MPRVYVTNQSGHDFSAAEKFGELVYLSKGKINPFQVTKMYKEFVVHLDSSASEDYILITGLSVMNSIAVACMAYKHSRINILQWHEGEHRYKSRTIVMGELLDKDNIIT